VEKINEFKFPEGKVLKGKYEIISFLGDGWEGEVYLVKEIPTGIERAAKFFFPHRNINNKASNFYAKKLHKLRYCDILIQYCDLDTIIVKKQKVTFLISELIEGELLSAFIKRKKKIHHFEALHILYELTRGMEPIHKLKEYHGDLHTENIIISPHGVGFDIKLIDLYDYGAANLQDLKDDVVDMINIFYEVLGGKKKYHKLPLEIKKIICGLKKSLITKKFKNAGQLRAYLEDMNWK